jgi:hypothetical protein
VSLQRPIIDVVIPAHHKDLDTLDYCIKSVRKNIQNVRRIIVVSKERYSNKAEWFDEKLYPFSFEEITKITGGSAGWYLQQLIKLYAVLVIPDISENVLVVDADTVFFRKISMFSSDRKPLYNLGKDQDILNNPFYQRSARHIAKLLPSLNPNNIPQEFQDISGITHHMLFQKKVIEDLFRKVEENDGSGDKFYQIFLELAERGHSVAEYGLYYWFILVYYFNQVEFRRLKYKNTAILTLFRYQLTKKYHYCSFHSYMRRKRKSFKDYSQNIKNFCNKAFFQTVWNVGIADCRIENFLTQNNIKINWFNDPKINSFIADPFGFEWLDGNQYVIYEYLNYFYKGAKIAVSKLSNKELVETKFLIDDGVHTSYPFVLKDDDNIYLVLERSKINCLDLYKFSSPYKITKVKAIIENTAIADPTIIKYNNTWWLFFVDCKKGDEFLHIAYCDDLLGDWKLHPKNPVKTDATSSRPAGTPFIFEGNLYRPAQNGSKKYGGSIKICKIIQLDKDNFKEEVVKEVLPDQNYPYNKGIHTISSFGDITLVDGNKIKFTPFKFLFSIGRNLLRLLRKIKDKKLVN